MLDQDHLTEVNLVKREFLLQGAAWQDTLLQSYRALHLTFQSILLAIGIGLVISLISSSELSKLTPQNVVIVSLFAIIWKLQRFASTRIREIILARGDDVNYWHKQIIMVENGLPSELRRFTGFKIHQQARRGKVSHLESTFLSEAKIGPENADELIKKGAGHTRNIVDKQIFAYISGIWWGLLFVVVGLVLYVLIQLIQAFVP